MLRSRDGQEKCFASLRQCVAHDLLGAGDLRIKQPIRGQNYLASLDLYASWEIACSAQASTNQPLSVN